MKLLSKSGLANLSNFFGLTDEPEYDEAVQENTYAQPAAENTRSQAQQATAQQASYTSGATYQQATAQQQQVKQENTYARDTMNRRTETKRKVVAMDSQNRKVTTNDLASSLVKKVNVVEPRTYSEAKTIAQHIFRNEVVIVNFHRVEEEQARRIVDFLTGAVYALDGDIQRIGNEMFLCTPPGLEIDSTIAKSLVDKQATSLDF